VAISAKKRLWLQKKLEFGIAQRFYACTQKVHRPRSQSSHHSDIRTCSRFALENDFAALSAFASRRHARALAA